MSAEKNKMLVRRFFSEGFNKGSLTHVNEFIASNFVNHDPATPDLPSGPEGYKQLITTYRTAFPDVYMNIEDMIAEGNQVVVRWTAHGRQTGPLMSIPPTGKQGTVTGISIFRLTDGLITETWVNWDTWGMLQQLGVVPSLAQTMR